MHSAIVPTINKDKNANGFRRRMNDIQDGGRSNSYRICIVFEQGKELACSHCA
ncbi:hypothetical protein NPIL_424201, partial [Nephila pilipes]